MGNAAICGRPLLTCWFRRTIRVIKMYCRVIDGWWIVFMTEDCCFLIWMSLLLSHQFQRPSFCFEALHYHLNYFQLEFTYLCCWHQRYLQQIWQLPRLLFQPLMKAHSWTKDRDQVVYVLHFPLFACLCNVCGQPSSEFNLCSSLGFLL